MRPAESSTSCPSWRVALVHIPKCGGSSLLGLLARLKLPYCDYGSLKLTGFKGCSCRSSYGCANSSRVLSVEGPYADLRTLVSSRMDSSPSDCGRRGACVPAGTCTMFTGIIRRPEDWFYSAIGQWCSGDVGKRNAGCQLNATLPTMHDAGWFPFARGRARSEAVATAAAPTALPFFGFRRYGAEPVKYFFRHADLQLRMLGGIS